MLNRSSAIPILIVLALGTMIYVINFLSLVSKNRQAALVSNTESIQNIISLTGPIRVSASPLTTSPNSNLTPSPTSQQNNTANTGPSHLWEATSLDINKSSTFSQPKIADLFGDGQQEIISTLSSVEIENCATQIKQGVYAWNKEGILLTGFPVYFPALDAHGLCGYLGIVGIGDVVGDSKPEIVVTTGRAGYPNGTLYVISGTGQILYQWTISGYGFSSSDVLHPVLADLDNNAKLEIIATGWGQNKDNRDSKLFAWRGNGSPFPTTWPQVTAHNRVFYEPTIVSGPIQRLVVVDTVTAYTGGPIPTPKLRFFAPNGNPLWITDLADATSSISEILIPSYQTISGDLDNNGRREVVVHTTGLNDNPTRDQIIIVENGQIKNRWLSGAGWSYDRSLSLGDLNSDGNLEIVYHDSTKVYAIDYQGNSLPGFPRNIWDGDFPSPPYTNLTSLGIADLDDDGYPDIYGEAFYPNGSGNKKSHKYSMFAINHLGQTLSGFPYDLVNYSDIPPDSWTSAEKYMPIFTDLDGDGFSELIASKGFGRIEAIRVNQKYRPEKSFVPQYGVNGQNTKAVSPSNGLGDVGGKVELK